MIEAIFTLPLTQLILWTLLIVALAIGVFEAICEASRQLVSCDRVLHWDWVAYMFVLGWLFWAKAAIGLICQALGLLIGGIDALTWWARVHCQWDYRRRTPVPADDLTTLDDWLVDEDLAHDIERRLGRAATPGDRP